jgi:drug/metabolite transporter (DMT)-like permease
VFRSGMAYLLIAGTGYAFFPIFAAQLSAGGMHPFDIATIRFTSAAALLWVLVGIRRVPSPRMPRLALIASGPFMLVAALTAFFGLEMIPASVYVSLFYTYPAMVAVISALRGEKLGTVAWIALWITLIGAVLMLPDVTTLLQGGAPVSAKEPTIGSPLFGVVLALVNGLAVAIYFLLSGRLMRGYPDPVRGSAWSIMGSALPMLILALFRPLNFPADAPTWGAMIGLIIVATVMPIAALNTGIHRLGAARAAILSMFEPVMTLSLSVLVLGDRLSIIQVIGALCIISSIVLVQVRGTRGKPAEPAAVPQKA